MTSDNKSLKKSKTSNIQNNSSTEEKIQRECPIECVLVKDDGEQVPIEVNQSNFFSCYCMYFFLMFRDVSFV